MDKKELIKAKNRLLDELGRIVKAWDALPYDEIAPQDVIDERTRLANDYKEAALELKRIKRRIYLLETQTNEMMFAQKPVE